MCGIQQDLGHQRRERIPPKAGIAAGPIAHRAYQSLLPPDSGKLSTSARRRGDPIMYVQRGAQVQKMWRDSLVCVVCQANVVCQPKPVGPPHRAREFSNDLPAAAERGFTGGKTGERFNVLDPFQVVRMRFLSGQGAACPAFADAEIFCD
ncbi:hypothetical protein BKA80DRAFT_18194 [Phyllosticta citrichinensis]